MRVAGSILILAVLVSGCGHLATRPAAPSEMTATAIGAVPAVDFASWRDKAAGPLTQIATLGSEHLSVRGPDFDPALLVPLIDKLAAFNPDIITHEGLSGEQCELVQRHAAIYPDIFDGYCSGTDEGRIATGLSMPTARAKAELLLKSWPRAPSPSQRRELAAIFMASGDRNSALVQWLQLPASERVAGNGLDKALIAILEKQRTSKNETTLIAAVLAARLGHQRVYAVDDHTADQIQGAAPDGFAEALEAHWKTGRSSPRPEIQRYIELSGQMTTPDGVLAMYRYLQAPETQRAFVETDFMAALALPSTELHGRQYLAWNETRNLRMVANVRAAFGNRPGARVLNIVGASHKAYYDAYLDQMSDVVLVDTAALLN